MGLEITGFRTVTVRVPHAADALFRGILDAAGAIRGVSFISGYRTSPP